MFSGPDTLFPYPPLVRDSRRDLARVRREGGRAHGVTVPRISHVMIDSLDPDALAKFWSALLSTEVESRFDEGRFVFLAAGKHGPAIGIQRVPENGRAHV